MKRILAACSQAVAVGGSSRFPHYRLPPGGHADRGVGTPRRDRSVVSSGSVGGVKVLLQVVRIPPSVCATALCRCVDVALRWWTERANGATDTCDWPHGWDVRSVGHLCHGGPPSPEGS
jgi:hypothetical protein